MIVNKIKKTPKIKMSKLLLMLMRKKIFYIFYMNRTRKNNNLLRSIFLMHYISF